MISGAVQLGPLLLPYALLLVIASVGTCFLVGTRLTKNSGVDVEAAIWRTLIVGFVAARLGFVFEYRALYFADPLTLLDFRDGGWNEGIGLAVAWLYAIGRQRTAPQIARPLRWTLGAGTAVFIAGSAFLAFRPESGQTLPDLAFDAPDGRTVSLAQFSGKPVVVNLWATWCPPCVREMPVLHEAQVRHPDVHFVFINQGESPAIVNRWLQAQGLALQNMLIDERRQASAAFKLQGYPTTLFFDARGGMVSRRIGELSAATLQEKLQQMSR